MARTIKLTTDHGDQIETLRVNDEGQTTMTIYPRTEAGEDTPAPIHLPLSADDVMALAAQLQGNGYEFDGSM